ncbi:MAG TPA: hypothetical protein VFA26_17795 [Gemmataceae bacterium]|nr:hypothetical protein [Gemmataceae bacterium]
MAVTLSLGGVVFHDFEVPESINFGGGQSLAVHSLPGGKRVVDAMGPDDADIRWSGRFRGPNAEERALLLDFMRRKGGQVLLTWSLHRYQVVIREFTANFQQPFEIPYSIVCAVVLDEVQSLANVAVGFVEAMAADLLAAVGLGDQIGMPAISTALTGVAAAFSNYQAGVPTATNLAAGTAAASEATLLDALSSSISVAQAATSDGITAVGSAITTTGSVAGVTAGGAPAAMASGLSGQSSAFGQLNLLYQLKSTLSRMSVNTSNAGS